MERNIESELDKDETSVIYHDGENNIKFGTIAKCREEEQESCDGRITTVVQGSHTSWNSLKAKTSVKTDLFFFISEIPYMSIPPLPLFIQWTIGLVPWLKLMLWIAFASKGTCNVVLEWVQRTQSTAWKKIEGYETIDSIQHGVFLLSGTEVQKGFSCSHGSIIPSPPVTHLDIFFDSLFHGGAFSYLAGAISNMWAICILCILANNGMDGLKEHMAGLKEVASEVKSVLRTLGKKHLEPTRISVGGFLFNVLGAICLILYVAQIVIG